MTDPLPIKPTGETRPGDLRYNLMVRLGNLGCTHGVDHLDTDALREHWREHLRARNGDHPGTGEPWERIPPWRILKIIRNAWRWRQMSRGLERGIRQLEEAIKRMDVD